MAAATPTAAAVVSATVTQIAAIATPIAFTGKVDGYFPRFPNRWEYLKGKQNTTTGQLDHVFVDLESIQELEGPASGENYDIYNIAVWYYGIRLNDTDWKHACDVVTESIRDKLSKNSSIFAIGGQRQLVTPETVNLRSAQLGELIIDEHGNPQWIYEAQIAFQVEGRRWT